MSDKDTENSGTDSEEGVGQADNEDEELSLEDLFDDEEDEVKPSIGVLPEDVDNEIAGLSRGDRTDLLTQLRREAVYIDACGVKSVHLVLLLCYVPHSPLASIPTYFR